MSPVSTIVISTRRALARRPWLQWALIVALAAVVATSVHGHIRRSDAERDAWAETRTVFVAASPTDIGESPQVERIDVPVGIMPDGAVAADQTIDGLVARQRIGLGEIITEIDLIVDAGPQAMTPPGWLAVPIVESPPSGARLGDRVQVASDGFVISADAVVVGRLDGVTMLAVPADEAPLLPAASASGTLTLLLEP
jgi:hypothetical protein